MVQPSVLIGSSSEGLQIARDIRSQLKNDAEITIWHEGIFGLGDGTLESLVNALDNFDFAVLVLTPDDVIKSREQESQSPRDNVLFELGLFMGRFGRHRTFTVYDKDSDIKLPSDLAGVTLAPYKGTRQDGNLLAALGEACDPIREAIKSQGALLSRKIDGIEIGSFRFKEIFGRDVFSPGAFHLAYAQLALRPVFINGTRVHHLFVKPGEENSGHSFSIERPISSCEVRGAKYLAESMNKEAKISPSLISDKELQNRLDCSFAAFGGPASNYKTRDVITNGGNNLLSFDNQKFTASGTDKVILKREPDFDYGLILKIHPTQFPNRTWFTCAGLGEWGTSGASWFLANKWNEIHDYAGNSPFAIIIRVRREQDESSEPVIKVKSRSDVDELISSVD